jgi:hypothetical protein
MVSSATWPLGPVDFMGELWQVEFHTMKKGDEVDLRSWRVEKAVLPNDPEATIPREIGASAREDVRPRAGSHTQARCGLSPGAARAP